MSEKKFTLLAIILFFLLLEAAIVYGSVYLVQVGNLASEASKAPSLFLMIFFNIILISYGTACHEYSFMKETVKPPKVKENEVKRKKFIDDVEEKQFNPAKTVIETFDQQ